MLSIIKKVLILGLVMCISNAYSYEDVAKIGIEMARYDYKETFENKRFMSLSGPIYGINAEYTHYIESLLVGADIRLTIGREKYKGGLCNRDTGDCIPYSYNNIESTLIESRLIGGWRSDRIALYTGIGYRLKNDGSENKYSADRSSEYIYLPVGVKAIIWEDKDLSITPGIEYGFLLRGKQTTDHTKFLEGKTFHKQKKGYGIRGSIGVKIDKFEISPYINYWNIKNSDIVIKDNMYSLEPANTTTEIGLKISYIF